MKTMVFKKYRRWRMRYLSERESLCVVKKLQPFLLLHSPLEAIPITRVSDMSGGSVGLII